ncbi:gamma-butyrobetaine hydroxylase-like domain-containing protein [Ktedonobacter racemifer]|uniref:Gamma-butyrobetaine hydroxylase-like N-terminal domain-containing protein n=1 Tax=Ktedonobacter racemifer DSM 44963 TaxID=485913 RepID=D6U6W8_KTERA|nr:DUF971 domain-containing protein [Ktedonobacter racemifer]EFH80729.1 protein of unknown function DUF971 [Ktedonobacter racemifer DSM 44963]
MMNNYLVPVSFLLDEEKRQLILTWSDEHESLHNWETLRWACPCAWCAGEGGQPGMLQSRQSLTSEETTLDNLQPVGRYGLTPIWEDGHKTGIYTFEKLRAMCECDECKKNASQAERYPKR